MFAWSVNHLLTGITPHQNWDDIDIAGGGQYIAGGFRGSLIQLRGDWEFLANTLGFENWAAGLNMCWLCSASNTVAHLAWQDFGRRAAWRRTRHSHDEYMHKRGEHAPLLLRLVIGLSLGCVAIDILHTLDLGVTAHVIGNISQIGNYSTHLWKNST